MDDDEHESQFLYMPWPSLSIISKMQAESAVEQQGSK
jgi:hypothetical protein